MIPFYYKDVYRAIKLHEKFNNQLDYLSMNDEYIHKIKEILTTQLGKHIDECGQKLSKFQKGLKLIQG